MTLKLFVYVDVANSDLATINVNDPAQAAVTAAVLINVMPTLVKAVADELY